MNIPKPKYKIGDVIIANICVHSEQRYRQAVIVSASYCEGYRDWCYLVNTGMKNSGLNILFQHYVLNEELVDKE